MLAQIRSGATEASALFLTPYPNYFHDSHYPATLKWYLYTMGATPISLPRSSHLTIGDEAGKPVRVIDGVACVTNVSATLHLNYHIRIQLGHVCITQDLVNRVHAAPVADLYGYRVQAVQLPAGTVFGYTMDASQPYALDFVVEDDTVSNYGPAAAGMWVKARANPFLYFTPAVQDQIRSFYQAQLDAMVASGRYPESRLDRSYDINQGGTLFGCWFYKEGGLQFGAANHLYGWYSFNGAIVNLLDVAKTDRNTFTLDSSTGQPFGAAMVGVYSDAQFAGGSYPGYLPVGGRYMVRISGDDRSGVVRLDPFFSVVRPGPIFLKYTLDERGNTNMYDDLLHLEYFSTAEAAAGPFSASKLTYIRLYERTD